MSSVICTNTMRKAAADLHTVGLLGTRFTMEQDFYRRAWNAAVWSAGRWRTQHDKQRPPCALLAESAGGHAGSYLRRCRIRRHCFKSSFGTNCLNAAFCRAISAANSGVSAHDSVRLCFTTVVWKAGVS